MEVCSKCGNHKVIIKRKQSGQALCENCFIENIQKKVIKTIKKEKLIDKGDKILVALSGGKDSVAVLDILHTFYEKKVIDISTVTIDEGISKYRDEGVKIATDYAKELGIEHEVISFKDSFGLTLDKIMKKSNHRGSCSYCGVFRRWIINKSAKKLHANKIATGHNLDDETQAILMNYLEGNIHNLSKIGPKIESKVFVPKIKPLREVPEYEIGLYGIAKNLNIHRAACPYAKTSFRMEISQIMKKLSENHPTIMYSTLKGFDKIKTAIKNQYRNSNNFSRCKVCGEPSSSSLCQVCSFLKELNNK
ncbi:MAG: TIGR00269 family protein [Methanobrevibacter sp.]|jgi:uncharacterized protein (TIGR00269 family)|nr:TIGR00269 family protein [Candidatus Methanovirga basalitermitum]